MRHPRTRREQGRRADMRVGTATVRSTGPRSFDLDVGDVELQARTDGDGRLMRLTVPDAKVVIER